MKLYELSKTYQDLIELIDVGVDVFDTLESIRDAIDQKAENIAKVVVTLDRQAEMIRDEEKRLYEKRRSIESRISSLKQYLEQELRRAGIEKVKGQIFTVAMQRNSPSVEIVDEALIPKEYIKEQITVSIDKKSLLEALKDNVIPGAQIKQTESVRIR
jgi:hypothetical protein